MTARRLAVLAAAGAICAVAANVAITRAIDRLAGELL
jgi:HAMP domain-containing protein